MAALTLLAPAKLNLFLHITGKRKDAYHTLESLVVFTEYGDRLTFAIADELSLKVDGPFATALDKDNLVLRAARALQDATRTQHGAEITLEKNLPVGAGLGGGSADAAACLRGLNRLWNLSLTRDDLHTLGMTLGADVPICIDSRTALMSGIGEHLSPVTVNADVSVLLVNPCVSLSTADIFTAFDGHFVPSQHHPDSFSTQDTLVDYLQTTENSLQSTAIRCLPIINNILEEIAAEPECQLARMSGSGATCFGLYPSPEAAEHAAQHLQHNHPNWWIRTSKIHGTS